jgi:hypothetical protein
MVTAIVNRTTSTAQKCFIINFKGYEIADTKLSFVNASGPFSSIAFSSFSGRNAYCSSSSRITPVMCATCEPDQ